MSDDNSDSSPPARAIDGEPRDSLLRAESLQAESLMLLRETLARVQNSEVRRNVWGVYYTIIIAIAAVTLAIPRQAGDIFPGLWLGSLTSVAVLHGLSMRCAVDRWRFSLYCLAALIFVNSFTSGRPAELALLSFFYFTISSSVATVLGARLKCGMMPPDEPTDDRMRATLLGLFAVTSVVALQIVLAEWLASLGDSSILGEDDLSVLVVLAGYAVMATVVAVAAWAGMNQWPGTVSKALGLSLVVGSQLCINILLALATAAARGDEPRGHAAGVGLATVVHLAVVFFVGVCLLATGHRAAPFRAREDGFARRNYEHPLEVSAEPDE